MFERQRSEVSSTPIDASRRYLFGFVSGDVGTSEIQRVGAESAVTLVRTSRIAAAVASSRGAGSGFVAYRSRHHEIVGAIASEVSILPVEPGLTVAAGESLEQFLRDHAQLLETELSRLRGTVEFGIRLRWSVEDCFEFLTRRYGRLADARDRTGVDSFEVSRRYDEAIRREREKFSNALERELSEACREYRPRACADESELAEARCLVREGRRAAFEREVYELAGQFADHVEFEFSHPFPPRTFVGSDTKELLGRFR